MKLKQCIKYYNLCFHAQAMWEGGRAEGFGGKKDSSENMALDTHNRVTLFDEIRCESVSFT